MAMSREGGGVNPGMEGNLLDPKAHLERTRGFGNDVACQLMGESCLVIHVLHIVRKSNILGTGTSIDDQISSDFLVHHRAIAFSDSTFHGFEGVGKKDSKKSQHTLYQLVGKEANNVTIQM